MSIQSVFYSDHSLAWEVMTEAKENPLSLKVLIDDLQKRGPLHGMGNFGPSTYLANPIKVEFSVAKNVYGWKNRAPRKEQKELNSILIVGALKTKTQEFVFFRQRNEERTFVVSYKRFTEELQNLKASKLFNHTIGGKEISFIQPAKRENGLVLYACIMIINEIVKGTEENIKKIIENPEKYNIPKNIFRVSVQKKADERCQAYLHGFTNKDDNSGYEQLGTLTNLSKDEITECVKKSIDLVQKWVSTVKEEQLTFNTQMSVKDVDDKIWQMVPEALGTLFKAVGMEKQCDSPQGISCFEFALKVAPSEVDQLIGKGKKWKVVPFPQAQDVILYYSTRQKRPLHAAIYDGGTKARSKMGTLGNSIFKHEIFDVQLDYGDQVAFLRRT